MYLEEASSLREKGSLSLRLPCVLGIDPYRRKISHPGGEKERERPMPPPPPPYSLFSGPLFWIFPPFSSYSQMNQLCRVTRVTTSVWESKGEDCLM